MAKDKRAELIVRDLGKMTKREVRSLVQWLELKAKTLKSLTAKDQLWLVKRKEYAPLFRMALMKPQG